MLRAATEQRVLAIPVKPALGTGINAVEFWRHVRLLRLEGYTDAAIAAAAGWTTGRLWSDHKRVTQRAYLRLLWFYKDHVSDLP